jgi:hypothetical protein
MLSRFEAGVEFGVMVFWFAPVISVLKQVQYSLQEILFFDFVAPLGYILLKRSLIAFELTRSHSDDGVDDD